MELFYRKLGSGPPLIIVHGLYGASDNWLSIGKSLSDQFTVYMVDQRNHGQSPHSRIHDYPSMRDDLLEFMDRHDLPKATLLGHSMGGKTVMFLSESNPERVDALIVIDITPIAYDSSLRPEQARSHEKIIGSMLGVDLEKAGSREEVDRQLAESIESTRIRGFLIKNLVKTKNGGYSWKLNLGAIRDSLPQILGGLDADKYRGGEEIAGFPVLFIRGEKSDYVSDDDILVIQQIFPMARVTTVPNAGHWLHVEQPALLLRTIRYFL